MAGKLKWVRIRWSTHPDDTEPTRQGSPDGWNRQQDPAQRPHEGHRDPAGAIRNSGPINPAGPPFPPASQGADRSRATGPLGMDMPAVPEPRVFGGMSTAGQAPWHLPPGAPPGLAADAALLGDLEVRAASVVGPGHRCEEPADPRQDAYALGKTSDGQYLIIAVADGVSQSRYADLGARVAVSTAARELSKMLGAGGIPAINTDLLHKVIAGEMTGTARSRGLTERDVCSILITAVIPTSPRPDGTRPIWMSWIGDVSLWIARNDGVGPLIGEEKSGLDPNALKAVLPFSPDQVQERQADLLPGDRVAVMTDGLSDSMRAVSGVTEYFARQWSGPPPHPAAFLHSLCYDAPGQTDDRTVVVVWCGAGGRGRPDYSGRRA